MEFLKIIPLAFIISLMLSEVLFELKTKIKKIYIQYIVTKLYCFKCLSFWLTLAITKDVYFATLNALCAIIFEETILPLLQKLNDKINGY
jgi:hypothetical protein